MVEHGAATDTENTPPRAGGMTNPLRHHHRSMNYAVTVFPRYALGAV